MKEEYDFTSTQVLAEMKYNIEEQITRQKLEDFKLKIKELHESIKEEGLEDKCFMYDSLYLNKFI